VLTITSRVARTGGAITGKMRRRTMAMAALQQRQSSLCRSDLCAGVDSVAVGQSLNLNVGPQWEGSMKFELERFNRNVTDEYLLQDLVAANAKLKEQGRDA